jgi:hypothetical protein
MKIQNITQEKFLQNELAERQFLFHCYNGTIKQPGRIYSLFSAGESQDYLIQFKKETDADFLERWAYSRYQNYTKRTIKRYIQAINGIKNDENEYDVEYQDWNERILPDSCKGLGVKWHIVENELCKMGWVALLWDADLKAWQIKTATEIYVDQLHDWMLDDEIWYWEIDLDTKYWYQGLKELDKSKIRRSDINNLIFDQKSLKKTKGCILTLDDNISLQSGLMWDVAWLNWSLYNLQSWSDQYKKDNSFALMIMQTDDQGKIPAEITVGNSYVQKYLKDCAAPAFISPAWEVIRELREDLKDLKQELSEISGLGTIADKFTEKQSGTALSLFYSDKFNSFNDLVMQFEEQEIIWHKTECRLRGKIQDQDKIYVKYNRVEPEKMMMDYSQNKAQSDEFEAKNGDNDNNDTDDDSDDNNNIIVVDRESDLERKNKGGKNVGK